MQHVLSNNKKLNAFALSGIFLLLSACGGSNYDANPPAVPAEIIPSTEDVRMSEALVGTSIWQTSCSSDNTNTRTEMSFDGDDFIQTTFTFDDNFCTGNIIDTAIVNGAYETLTLSTDVTGITVLRIEMRYAIESITEVDRQIFYIPETNNRLYFADSDFSRTAYPSNLNFNHVFFAVGESLAGTLIENESLEDESLTAE